MSKEQQPHMKAMAESDRRSSVRVKSRLPCSVEPIDKNEIAAREAQILDTAVMESDGVMHDSIDWRDHAEELSGEIVFVLNEIRALRQQVTEVQRVMERYNQTALERRWIELNDQGLWLPADESARSWKVGEFAFLRIQIPSMQTPEVLAVGEVLRIDDDEERKGTAFEFCSISEPHKKAISRYALRRERQLARMERLDIDFE